MAAELDYFHLPSTYIPGGTVRYERCDIPALPSDQMVFHHSSTAGKIWRAVSLLSCLLMARQMLLVFVSWFGLRCLLPFAFVSKSVGYSDIQLLRLRRVGDSL
jgi:hypothetical protein